MRRRFANRCRGVALLTVMLIIVMLTTLLVYLVEDEHLAIRRIANQRDLEQSYQMAAGAEQWALKILERDMRESNTDHPGEAWNQLLPEVGVEEGTLSASAEDLQGRINLNNIAQKNDDWYLLFKRLLEALELDESLADALLDRCERRFVLLPAKEPG